MNDVDTILHRINAALEKMEAENPAAVIKELTRRNQELEQLLHEAKDKMDGYLQALNQIMQNSEPQEEDKKIAVNE